MDPLRTDICIIGAGIAGASLAAAIGDRARVVLVEGESQPGYHSTGRSAAFWSESYGGPAVQPLTTASHAALAPYLRPRGCLHIADADGEAALDRLAIEFAGRPPWLEPLDRARLEETIPGLSPGFRRGLAEPSCADIDVAALHAAYLREARRAGAVLRTDAPVLALRRGGGGWEVDTRAGTISAAIVVNAAGAWASEVASMAGAQPIAITPYRRTVVQIATDPAADAALPLVMDARGRFYFKPEGQGRLWLSPHDETGVAAHDVAAEELDVAIAIHQFEQVVDWRVVRRDHALGGAAQLRPRSGAGAGDGPAGTRLLLVRRAGRLRHPDRAGGGGDRGGAAFGGSAAGDGRGDRCGAIWPGALRLRGFAPLSSPAFLALPLPFVLSEVEGRAAGAG